MGFSKKYIKKEVLLSKYKTHGIHGVHKYFIADALFVNDDFSSNILYLLDIGKDDDAVKLLDIELQN